MRAWNRTDALDKFGVPKFDGLSLSQQLLADRYARQMEVLAAHGNYEAVVEVAKEYRQAATGQYEHSLPDTELRSLDHGIRELSLNKLKTAGIVTVGDLLVADWKDLPETVLFEIGHLYRAALIHVYRAATNTFVEFEEELSRRVPNKADEVFGEQDE